MEKVAARLQDVGSAITVIGLLMSLVGAIFLSFYLQGMLPLLNFGEHAAVSLLAFLGALGIYILLNIHVAGILYDKTSSPRLRLLFWSAALVSEIVVVLGVIVASAAYLVSNRGFSLNTLLVVTLFEAISKLGLVCTDALLRRSLVTIKRE